MLLSKYCTMINDKNVREGNRKKLFTSQCLTGSLKKSKSNQPYWGGGIHTLSYLHKLKMLGQYHVKFIKAPHLLKLVVQIRSSRLQLRHNGQGLALLSHYMTLDESPKAVHSGSI